MALATATADASFEVPFLVYDTVEATSKYSKYLTRQEDEMSKWKKAALVALPVDLDYSRENFPSLSSEELEKLKLAQPSTLHAASQISGVTPNALVFLHNFVSKGRNRRASSTARQQTGSSFIDGSNGGENAMPDDFFVSPEEANVNKHFEEIATKK